jgi:tetratricopeptide (TPR) repeat protein
MKKISELLILLVLLAVFILLGKNKLAAFYYNRGNNYYKRNLYKEAIDYFSKSLKINHSVALVHYGLANAYLNEKSEDKAIEEYKKTIQLDSRFLWGYKALAHMYLRREWYQEAIDILRKAKAIIPDNPEIEDLINYTSFEYVAQLINAGVEAFSIGDKLRAHELLNKALQINPNFLFTRYLLGYFYYSTHKYDEAEVMLNEAIRLNNKFFLAHKLLGDIYFEKKIFKKAVVEYKVALSINRNDSTLLNNLGLAFMNLENYNEAIPFLKEALSLNPGNVNIRYSLASVYRDSGRLSEAVSEYKNIINAHPDYPNVHNDLADIYREQGRTQEALEEYRKEIYFCQNKLSGKSNDPFLLADMSYAYNGIGDYAKAKELIDKALTLKPDYREAYLTLASIHRNLGDSVGALAALEKAKGLSAQRYFFIEKTIHDIKELKGFASDKIISPALDMVYLKNGRLVEGRIKRETEDDIILEINVGSSTGTVTLSRDSIERIVSKYE